jgi:hypothetical protein
VFYYTRYTPWPGIAFVWLNYLEKIHGWEVSSNSMPTHQASYTILQVVATECKRRWKEAVVGWKYISTCRQYDSCCWRCNITVKGWLTLHRTRQQTDLIHASVYYLTKQISPSAWVCPNEWNIVSECIPRLLTQSLLLSIK